MTKVNAAVIGAGFLACLLGGCTTYMADVRNKTPQPLVAELVCSNPSKPSKALLARQRIAPGDRAGLLRNDLPHDWHVFLQVDTEGNPGTPAKLNLGPGTTVINVTQEGEGQNGALKLEAQSQ